MTTFGRIRSCGRILISTVGFAAVLISRTDAHVAKPHTAGGGRSHAVGSVNRQTLVDTLDIFQARRVPTDWDKETQGGYVISVCFDKRGNVWCGTEDKGLWRCAIVPGQRHWNGVTVQKGLGDDNAYAMACDHQGRIWVGTLNHGVSVFNGEEWRNYGPGDGPIGAHVTSIAVSPISGDVWMATDSGLTRYSVSEDTWSHYTRLDGLPNDWATALAFDPHGKLYVGTNADGLAIAAPESDYRHWTVIRGPEAMPISPSGAGLPTSQITTLLGSRTGVVYAGTTRGLARSSDGGAHWKYLRGRDWLSHVTGVYGRSKARLTNTQGHRLRQDYISALAEDDDGHLYVGYREHGVEVIDPQSGDSADGNDDGSYVRCLIPLPSGHVLVGTYADGLKEHEPVTKNDALPLARLERRLSGYPDTPPRDSKIAALPTPSKAPSLTRMREMIAALHAVRTAWPDPDKPSVVTLDDDWTTEGDWLGRYGRYWACLCAICSPDDYIWGAGWQHVDYSARIGPNHKEGDNLRYWVHWLYTDNPRTLELPPTYLDSRIRAKLTTPALNRRQAEQDDHGEDYPMGFDGPHIYYTIRIPSGQYLMSMYEYNKDGHDWSNRYRDYLISIRQHPNNARLDDISSFSAMPELAHGRIVDFWGGVWKRYLVTGPTELTIKLDRNNSLNAILPTVMLDLLDPEPAPYFRSVADWNAECARGKADAESQSGSSQAASQGEAADRILEELHRLRYRNPGWWAQNNRRFYEPLIKWYSDRLASQPADRSVTAKLGECYYGAGMYPQWENCQRACSLMPARDIEKALKWDGISDEGDGFSVVSQYVASMNAAQPAARNVQALSGRENVTRRPQ